MNLDISTSIEFVKERTEKTSAVQTILAALPTGAWVWPLKTVAQWTDDQAQLDGAKNGTLAYQATAAATDLQIKFSAMTSRYALIHARTLQAVGVMRSRALANPALRPVVDELSARGDSKHAIEEEGAELLSAWEQEFGEDFIPASGNTYTALLSLMEGTPAVTAADGTVTTPAMPALGSLKSTYKQARTKARRAEGDYNVLIVRLEDECVQWYAEATAVFPAGTTDGDLIRGQIATIYNPPTAAPATA